MRVAVMGMVRCACDASAVPLSARWKSDCLRRRASCTRQGRGNGGSVGQCAYTAELPGRDVQSLASTNRKGCVRRLLRKIFVDAASGFVLEALRGRHTTRETTTQGDRTTAGYNTPKAYDGAALTAPGDLHCHESRGKGVKSRKGKIRSCW